jgi:hypothetical protein
MYKKVLIIFLFFIALIGVSSAMDITFQKGETWVVWNWTIPSEYINTGHGITVWVDGLVTYNVSLDTNLTIPYNYYLTNVNPNEEHNLKISVYNSSGSVDLNNSIVRTRYSDILYYVLFIVSIQLLLLSVFVRNKLFSVVFGSFSLFVFLFIAYVFIGYNPSFSNIGIICAVLSGFIIVYHLYELYVKHSGWDGGY